MTKRNRAAALIFGLTFLPMPSLAAPIKAQIFRMPEFVETAAVTTAGHYILASHLVRALTKLDKFGKIQADIAVKWMASSDHKTWTLTLRPTQFSDGSALTAHDVAASIARSRKLGAGVHFPFSQINAVRVLSPAELEITLAAARNDFIYDLSKPEFGVLSPADAAAEKDKATFTVTSGAYSLQARSPGTFHLKRNPHFQEDAHNNLDLVMESSNGETSADALKSRKLSFFTTQASLTEEAHAALAVASSLRTEKPHVGFSYWLSINPRSPYFSSPSHRAALQKYVRAFQSPEMKGHSWERAEQLYLPDGEGRPTAAQLKNAWAKIEQHAATVTAAEGKPVLRVVLLKTSIHLLHALLEFLSRRFTIEVVPCSTEEELVALLKSNQFDLKFSSNDFSSIDLSENLKTTFNSSRPYVFLNEGSPVPELLQRAVETTDKAVRSKIFQEIALELLERGLVAPVAYQRVWFYFDKRLGLDAWSKIFPEISFWKVQVSQDE